MKTDRPIYLDLHRIRQPIPAVVSFLHRLSGAFLFLLIPFLLSVFEASLASQAEFASVLSSLWVKVMLFGVLAAFFYHLFAGLRFLLLDMGLGVALTSARRAAWLVIGASIVSSAVLGVWLW